MNAHAHFIKLGLDKNPVSATRLLNQYIRHTETPHSLSSAHKLFDETPQKDTVLWTSLISAYVRFGYPSTALQLFSTFLKLTSNPFHKPNHFTYATAARACGALPEKGLNLGSSLHSHVVKLGMLTNHVVVETAFLDMYAKCGNVDCSRRVFDEMLERNGVTWNAMIAGYVQNRMEFDGFNLFYGMKCKAFYVPDEFCIGSVLAGCANVRELRMGVEVHGYLVRSGLELDCLNSLCNMYFQCGKVSCAERILEGTEIDPLLKLTKIRGYGVNQRHYDVIKCAVVENQVAQFLALDNMIIVPVLAACAKLSLLRVGKQVHGLLITLTGFCEAFSFGQDCKAIIGSALIDMYSKCGSIPDAHIVFQFFQLHSHVSCWNSLVTGYMYNGLVEEARGMFDLMIDRNVISWTCMISGYVQNGLPQESLNLLAKMYIGDGRAAVYGNCLTFVSGLDACNCLAYTLGGMQIHAKIVRTLADAHMYNTMLGTALLDMYAKAGKLDYARASFDQMLEKNVVAWTSMIMGHAVNGLASHALLLFQQMIDIGIQPNEITFLGVLSACSHCGFIDEGLHHLNEMMEKYNLVPGEDHYTCMINMLGRVGRLEEAWNLLISIECRERCTGSMSAALLGACSLHGNVEIGRRVVQMMLHKNQQVSTAYIALSNIYAAAGMWNEVYTLRECWRRRGYGSGEPGCSQILASRSSYNKDAVLIQS